jgi:hypothetical protein
MIPNFIILSDTCNSEIVELFTFHITVTIRCSIAVAIVWKTPKSSQNRIFRKSDDSVMSTSWTQLEQNGSIWPVLLSGVIPMPVSVTWHSNPKQSKLSHYRNLNHEWNSQRQGGRQKAEVHFRI